MSSVYSVNGVSSITKEMFESMKKDDKTFQKFFNQWEKSHQELIELLDGKNIPFFGLHGTRPDQAKGIINEDKSYLNLATFYEKPINIQLFLFQLYLSVHYVLGYSYRGLNQNNNDTSSGNVLVLDLNHIEQEKNITLPRQSLIFTNLFDYFNFFEKYQTEMSEIKKKNYYMRRTDGDFKKDKILSNITVDRIQDNNIQDTVQNTYFTVISDILGSQLVTKEILLIVLSQKK